MPGEVLGSYSGLELCPGVSTHEGTSKPALLGVFVPPGALPCRLGGWGETTPFSKKPSLRLTGRWAALFLLCFPLKVKAVLPAGLSKSEVPPRLCLERSLFLLWKQSISVNYQPSPEGVDQVTTEKDPEQGHPGEKAQPGCAPGWAHLTPATPATESHPFWTMASFWVGSVGTI